MNSLFYAKMAVSNIRKNKKIFFPYIIMGIFSVMMYYMMVSLMNNDGIRKMPYSDNILALLPIGLWVARIFIVVFLFYINSFLMKQRLKEIGLYNILGMEKRHIAVMMFFENVFVFITVFVSGMILGMVFSKLMFLILMKMIAVSSVPKFQMEMTSVFMTGGYFLAIYFVTFLYNLCKIHLSNPVELLHGTEAGEKEPKTKILMTLIGLCCIGFGYYFALTTKSPMAAMNTFFIAVILVVIGTYALFTAGSIALLKLMRKNKHFYYRTGHFFSISGMIYRMKQNAAGLANICILSTMVLISISTTVSLYAGIQTTIAARSPKEIDVTANLSDYEDTAAVDEEIAKINEAHQVTVKDYTAVHSMGMITAYGGDGKYTLADGKGLVIADEKQGEIIMNSVHDRLNTKYGAILMDPPYHAHAFDGALAVIYNAGTKENAGIFSQSQGWIILAEALMGHGERAFGYFMENAPAAQNDKAEIRRLEPYCYGQFTEGKASPNFGRSHVHWLTGTASTVMVGCVEGILGMRPDFYGLRIAPSIPKEWDGFEVKKDFRGCHLHIKVQNPGHAESGFKKLTVNGEELKDNYIPQEKLTAETEVELYLS